MPPAEPIERLEPGQRQLVAIARALSLDARLIIMDEPTAALDNEEAARLERLVRRLTQRGVAVVYISHRLDEVRRLAQRVTVLRDGRRIATRKRRGPRRGGDGAPDGRPRDPAATLEAVPSGAAEVLRVENLSVADPNRPDGFRVRDVSISLRRGEIVGLAGLIGAGRTDFLLALAGASPGAVSGRVVVEGREAPLRDPAAARRAGLTLLPEERKAQAIFPDLGVGENIVLGALEKVSGRLGVVRTRGGARRGAGG